TTTGRCSRRRAISRLARGTPLPTAPLRKTWAHSTEGSGGMTTPCSAPTGAFDLSEPARIETPQVDVRIGSTANALQPVSSAERSLSAGRGQWIVLAARPGARGVV